MAMKIYEADDGSIYFIVARNLREAIDVLWRSYEEDGSSDYQREELEELSVFRISDEKARKILISDEDDQSKNHTTKELADAATEACVLGNSEWP